MSTLDKEQIAKCAEDALIALSTEVCNIIDDIEDYSKTLSAKSRADMLRLMDIRDKMKTFEETPMILSQTIIGFRLQTPRFISREAFEELYLIELWCTMEAFHDSFIRMNRDFLRYNRPTAENAIKHLAFANRNL